MRIRQGKTHAPQALSFFYCVPESRRVLLTVTSPAVHFAPIRSGRSRSKKVLSKLFSLFAPAHPYPHPPLLHPSGELLRMSWEKHPLPGELKCLWCFSHTEDSSTHGSRQGWSGTQTWNFFSIWKDFTLWAKARQSDHRRSLTITDTQLIRGTQIILISETECFCSTFGVKLLLKCQKMRIMDLTGWVLHVF